MDALELTTPAFWDDPAPYAAGGFAGDLSSISMPPELVCFTTSGSSGEPKWVALSKQSLLVSAAAVNRHLGVSAASCWGLALPPHHVGGFGVAARAYAAGCAFAAFDRRWDAPAFAAWLDDRRITHTTLVPAQVHDLVATGLPAPAALRAIVVGGGALDGATGRAARARGWPVLASYGMTEAASQIATQHPGSLLDIYQPAPLPLLPIWQAETTPDDMLRIAGPALFAGWIVRKNGPWIYQARESEWHLTADRVRLADGGLTPMGRADTRVKVLGELIDLETIERELADLAAGQLAPGMFAVVAVPDARAGHVLVPAFDAAADPALIASVLTSYARQAPGIRRLGPAVTLVDFPRSPLGKPRRAEIAAAVGGNHR